MHKGIFITGTDTGVGKSFVAIGLMRAFKEMGLSVCPMKPVETGCKVRKGKLIPADTVKLINAANVNEPLDLINPYRFRQPLAPAVAAEVEGVVIKKEKILSACKQLSKRYDITIVEGAGGIMAPVYKRYLFLDLIKDLRLPVVIVARPGLGTINHTLLTINAARSNGIEVLGVIINYASEIKKDISMRTNPELIEGLGRVPVLGTLPFSNTLKKYPGKVFQQIAKNILSCL
ncbi:MAG: dethiobiotin synthase [Nitrospirae bacterium]|nr:dethiobiotin synthase [Nitrospirota bacterium]